MRYSGEGRSEHQGVLQGTFGMEKKKKFLLLVLNPSREKNREGRKGVRK